MLSRLDFSSLLEKVNRISPAQDEAKKLEYKEYLESIRMQSVRRAISLSGLPKLSKPRTIAGIVPKNVQQEEAIQTLVGWKLSKGFRLPYLYGPPGTGKSYIAKRFAYSKLVSGVEAVKFCTVSEFLIKYRNFDKKSTIDELLNPVILVLDDLCSHNCTRHTIELIHAVIDHRLRNRKPTLITSNVKPNNIAGFLHRMGARADVSKTMCEAISDRIFDLCSFSAFNFKSIRS